MQIPVHVHQLNVFLSRSPDVLCVRRSPRNSEYARLRFVVGSTRRFFRRLQQRIPHPAKLRMSRLCPLLPRYARSLPYCPSAHPSIDHFDQVHPNQSRQLDHAQHGRYSQFQNARFFSRQQTALLPENSSGYHLPCGRRSTTSFPLALPTIAANRGLHRGKAGSEIHHLLAEKAPRHALGKFRRCHQRARDFS